MQAWILDESPGTYRFGEIDPPPLAADDVRVRVVASALNHMDLWVTKGMPRPPLPHVPGCDVAGVVEAVGSDVTHLEVGDEVVINPGVSPVDEIVALGNDSPMGDGFMIYGEHCWGGHATFATAPARNVVRRPAGRTWEECAAYPLAYLTAYRMLRRARLQAGDTVVVVGIGSGVSTAALAIARQMGARVVATSRSEAKRAEALAMGADAAYDSGDRSWPVQADVVVESVGPATWEQSVRALKPGGRLVVCGGTSGPKVELTCPGCSSSSTRSSAPRWAATRSSPRSRASSTGPAGPRRSHVQPRQYPEAIERLTNGEQLGKIVLRHDRNVPERTTT
jgi:zinc-binding alcohol dehydrogenase/oxidoreductase